MEEFTRKFNIVEDKDEQILQILRSVYEALKEKLRPHQSDRGLHPL